MGGADSKYTLCGSSCPTTAMNQVKKNMIKALEPGLKSPEKLC